MMKRVTVAAATALLVLSGANAYAYGSKSKSKSKSKSNGTLYIRGGGGCLVSNNCSLYCSTTGYKKSGGSKGALQLAADSGGELFFDTQKTVVDVRTSRTAGGGKKKSAVPNCSIAGYMKASTGNYYTPNPQPLLSSARDSRSAPEALRPRPRDLP